MMSLATLLIIYRLGPITTRIDTNYRIIVHINMVDIMPVEVVFGTAHQM